MSKQVIIKAMYGNYDYWADIRPVEDDTDYIVFTDQDIESDLFEIRKTPRTDKIERNIKIKPWDFVGEGYDKYIWMDANIYPKTKVSYQDADIVCLEHPHRSCVYEELLACIRLEKDDAGLMSEQVAQYKSEGYPQNNGMVQTGLLVRPLTDVTREHADLWWAEVEKGSRRDQLSFNYAMWKMQAPPQVRVIAWKDFEKSFKLIAHRR